MLDLTMQKDRLVQFITTPVDVIHKFVKKNWQNQNKTDSLLQRAMKFEQIGRFS